MFAGADLIALGEIGHAQVIVHEAGVGRGFHRLLEEVDGLLVFAKLVFHPADGVDEGRLVGVAQRRDQCAGALHAGVVLAIFNQQHGQIVGRELRIGCRLQGLFVLLNGRIELASFLKIGRQPRHQQRLAAGLLDTFLQDRHRIVTTLGGDIGGG